MSNFSVRRFDPAKKIPYASLFAPGISVVETLGFEFETRPSRPSIRTVLSGEVTYEASGMRHTLRAGEYVVIGTGFRLLGGTAKKSHTICFSCYTKDSPNKNRSWPKDLFIKVPQLKTHTKSIFEKLANATHHGQDTNIEPLFDIAMGEFTEQVDEFENIANSNPAKRSRTRNFTASKMLEVRGVIEQLCFTPLDLDELSIFCGISKFHLTRLFRQAFGTTPHQYHEQKRLSEAAAALRTSQKPIGDVAQMFGYADPAAFSRAFARVIGVTPSKIRQQAF